MMDASKLVCELYVDGLVIIGRNDPWVIFSGASIRLFHMADSETDIKVLSLTPSSQVK